MGIRPGTPSLREMGAVSAEPCRCHSCVGVWWVEIGDAVHPEVPRMVPKQPSVRWKFKGQNPEFWPAGPALLLPGHAALWGGGLSRQALQWVWLMLWQPGPELGLRGVAGTGESQPW